MSAYGYDEDGEREHDCCPRCGRGSCAGSGSLGWDGCEAPDWTPIGRCIDCGMGSARTICADCRYWRTLEAPTSLLAVVSEPNETENADARTNSR